MADASRNRADSDDLPLEKLRNWQHATYWLATICWLVFCAVVSGVRQHDPNFTEDLQAFVIMIAVTGCCALVSSMQAVRRWRWAKLHYGSMMVVDENRFVHLGRRLRLIVVAGIIILFGFGMMQNPMMSVSISWTIAGTCTLGVALAFLPSRPKSPAEREEHASKLREQAHEIEEQVGPLLSDLERDLRPLLEELRKVRDNRRKEEQAYQAITKVADDHASRLLQRGIDTHDHKYRRKRFFYVVGSGVFSFLLGLIVNWISDPLLNLLKSLM